MIVILTKLDSQSLLLKMLCTRVLVFIGSLSYGIYMIHWLLCRLIAIFLSHVFNFPLVESTGEGTYFDLPASALTLTFFHITSLAVLIALATLSHRYFEKPIMARFFAN